MPNLVATNQGTVTSSATLTISITVPAGSNRLLLVKASCVDTTDKLSGATVTANGVSMGAAVLDVAGADRNAMHAWAVVAPTVGTYNVVLTASGSTFMGAVVEAWDDVDQSTPVALSDSTTNSFLSSPLSRTIAIASGQQATDLLCIRTSGVTLTPGGTQVGTTFNSGSLSTVAASRTPGVASATSWTFSGPTNGTYLALVLQAPVVGPTIGTQPTNQTVTAPAAATFTLAATGTGTLTYQWQRQPAAGGGYTNISGATSASYTTGATTVSGGSHNNNDTYRCNVTDSGGTTTSSVVTLTVNAAVATGTLTSAPLKNNTGTLQTSAPLEAFVHNVTTGALIIKKTGITSNGSGVATTSDAAITAATSYRVVWRRTDTGAEGLETLTAS